MKLNEAMNTIPQLKNPDIITDGVPNKMAKMIKLIKKKDELELTKLINLIPRIEIEKWIWRLNRYRFKKYPYTAVAISKMKWRRGF